MEETKFEVKLSYIISVSQLLTKGSITGLNWQNGNVAVTENGMWFPSDGGWDMIPLNSIEMVGRQLTGSVGNQILHATKYSNHLVIDYKKQALFGTGNITSSMILAGQEKDIKKVKNFLLTALGFRIDASFGELENEESRLLCLLASGMDNVDVLLPIFDGNKVLLKHAFAVLKKRKLVDDFASPTQLGLEYVEQVKGKGEGKLGSDINEAFGKISKSWKNVEQIKSTKRMNKVLWKFDNSSIAGRVATNELWRFIPIADIDEMILDDAELGTLRIHIRTKRDVSIYVEPIEKSTVFALYILLNNNEDMQNRLLFSIYLGIVQRTTISYIFNIQQHILDSKLNHMVEKGLIDSDNNLSIKGIEMTKDIISRKIKGEGGSTEQMSTRLEEMKMELTKKSVQEKLGGNK